ncbi:hypothetical protein [Brachybacterium fresconis]|uniref:Uncharacterized protein n=1 Tax=Brachybacterium fresconis TaxID=173363 RepID=A0ABS4YFR5_9MICO|nr:hypothetical protein [Brachybacterium fresconis]MBP2407460.1 hypothetical protein [Brachybacterium fresconis]
MSGRFNPPPNWPEPPREGWTPPEDFRPHASWGRVPAGWHLWIPEAPLGRGQAPLQHSEDVPASGARPRRRVQTYPVAVINPGMWTHNHLEDEDYGFPAAKPVPNRPRLRLGVTISVTVAGFLLAALTAVMFVFLVDFAIEDLPGVLSGAPSTLLAPAVDPGTVLAEPDAG